MINFENLDKMIAEKYISVQKHPTLDLYIYNYTQRAQFDRVWNNETLQCRGLIMDGNRNIVSRPFVKFFNLGELSDGQNPNINPAAGVGDFTVTEKMDGSLGISYFDPDGKMYIATRGSFVSDQAKKANEILATKYPKIGNEIYWNTAYTYLFEIIYPQNRIVVNYGDLEDLVLLAVIDSKGRELDYGEMVKIFGEDISFVQSYNGITDFTKIEQKPNSEGYVVHFPATGLRFKVKFDEYVRLHRILTGINAKRIWEILSAGSSLDDILDRVPDEFYAWVRITEQKLNKEFRMLEADAKLKLSVVSKFDSRKEQAQWLMKNAKYPGLVFNMLDGKDYSAQIWKIIEPKYETPFKVDSNDAN